MPNINELRRTHRFGAVEPLPGGFGSASITILNLASRGVQIEHSQPLRLALNGRLWFRRGDVAVSVQGRVVWSHLSKTRDPNWTKGPKASSYLRTVLPGDSRQDRNLSRV